MSDSVNTRTEASKAEVRQPEKFRIYNMNRYTHTIMAREMEEFVAGGKTKSGFQNLDAVTSIYPGLYVLGAISSLGKTTFMHQMADQMAAAGHPVIFFSLEQSLLDLVTKSLSRTMAEINALDAMTSLQIKKNGTEQRVQAAVDVYDRYDENFIVVECTFRVTIETIEEIVNKYIRQQKKQPVVIVDYLQAIALPEGNRMNDKERVDMHVRRLKQLQSDNKIVLFVISSLNRQNYLTQIDFESYKESGGIEYTADVVWGLQLEVLHDPLFDKTARINEKRQKVKEAKAAVPRRVELVCLKNRFGISSYSCLFDYYPQFDLFRPVTDKIDAAILNAETDQDGFVTIPEGFDLPFD